MERAQHYLHGVRDGLRYSGATFDAVLGSVYWIAVDGYSNTGAISLRWQAPPENDNFSNARRLSGSPGEVMQSNLGASLEGDEPNPVSVSGPDGSLWYRWQAPTDGVVVFDATGSSFNPNVAIAAYTGTALDALTRVAASYLPATVQFTAESSVEYRIQVYGFGGDAAFGDVELTWHETDFTPTPTKTNTVTPTPTETPTPTLSTTPTTSSTPTASATATKTLTSMVAGTPSATQTGARTSSPTATPTPTPIPCIGDCNKDGQVTIDELLTMVNIALGSADIGTCDAGAANHDTQITIDELLTAVNHALSECGI